ncbi:hypothetical protein GCM10025869_19110 [Homoserinibacter gongjuensis]|uniref:Uncharacterized protein n=2 Tax=Homoserinibacter gongjuensis TaxID=1162968 RepID=A0ABQ6JXD3_9MICO|nr:hypothetical protein GCM10025869_19110 [Homoserinibacter gongjuensis]
MAAYKAGLDAYSTAYQKQQAVAEAHQKAVGELAATAAKGGKDAVAAWESLLVVAGIAVDGPDGTPVALDGVTGSGWPLSDAELRTHAALAADRDGFMLTDLAHVLDAAFDLGDAELTQQLYDELQGIPDHGFWEVFWAVGPGLTDEHGLVAADQVFLDFAQVELLLRRLAAEAVVTGFELDPDAVTVAYTHDAASAGVQLASVRSSGSRAADKRPCELSGSPWGQQILNQFMKSHAKFIFDEGLKYLAKSGIMTSAGEWVSTARTFSAYASLIAKFAAITATYSSTTHRSCAPRTRIRARCAICTSPTALTGRSGRRCASASTCSWRRRASRSPAARRVPRPASTSSSSPTTSTRCSWVAARAARPSTRPRPTATAR